MNRVYLVRDDCGERSVGEADFPLTIGGVEVADIVLSSWPADGVAGYIALSEGHAYIQPAATEPPIFHNHERLGASAWLKSGDRVELGEAVVRWVVRGDQVEVAVADRASAEQTRLMPPATPPRALLPDNQATVCSAAAHARPRWRYLVMGLFAALLIFALFVLAASPVVISIAPEPDQMRLRGLPPPVSLWGRYLVLPGKYAISARREGYYPLRADIAVGNDGYREFAFSLRPLPGRVTVSVEPEIVFRLSVDGVEHSPNAQGVFEIAGGRRRLRVRTDRYLPEEREVDIAGFGRAQRVAYALRPAWAEVRIESDPAGAEVRVDGVAIGETPLQAEILEGLRELQYALPKHKTVKVQRQFAAGQKLALDRVSLPPADGRLSLSSQPAGATVSIAGDFRGRTPIDLALAANVEHPIRLIKGGYRAVEKKITLGPEQKRSLEVKLAPLYGTLFLATQPADAELYVNGKALGLATRRLRLPARSHTLEIRKPGYVTQRLQVTPRADASRTFQVQLLPRGKAGAGKSASAPPASAPASVTSKNGDVLALIRPSGPFYMGASRREAGRRANESRRQVTLTRPFYLGVKEVTNAQFRRFQPAHNSGGADGVALDGDAQPVVDVSWEAAARYCNWLNRQQGLPVAYIEKAGRLELAMPPTIGYRLPTEAEWAYAARIHKRAQSARYAWVGQFPPTTVAGNYADARLADTLADVVPGYDDGFRGTAPVASFAPSPPGFFDLSGNVAEWTNDYYKLYPATGGAAESDPLGPASGAHRVVRGSSWRHGNITELRLSYRDYSKKPRKDLGFRIARYAQ